MNEAKEVLVQLYAYCGFPRSLNGLNILMNVLEERKAQGVHDVVGRAASPITSAAPKCERGKQNLVTLTGKPEMGPKTGANAFNPEIDVFLKEHLFADIFERDVLTFQEREQATIAALVSLGSVEPMLRKHTWATDWSVGDIAHSLGFEYATYFHRFFKQHTGTTPLAFRQAA